MVYRLDMSLHVPSFLDRTKSIQRGVHSANLTDTRVMLTSCSCDTQVRRRRGWNEIAGNQSFHASLCRRSTDLLSSCSLRLSVRSTEQEYRDQEGWPLRSLIVVRLFSLFSKMTVLLTHLFYPLLILIDHGHFQFNSVSLGLALLAFIMATEQRSILLSAVFFTLSLNYKQMELYHAVPIFVYLLSSSCFEGKRLK